MGSDLDGILKLCRHQSCNLTTLCAKYTESQNETNGLDALLRGWLVEKEQALWSKHLNARYKRWSESQGSYHKGT